MAPANRGASQTATGTIAVEVTALAIIEVACTTATNVRAIDSGTRTIAVEQAASVVERVADATDAYGCGDRIRTSARQLRVVSNNNRDRTAIGNLRCANQVGRVAVLRRRAVTIDKATVGNATYAQNRARAAATHTQVRAAAGAIAISKATLVV